MEIASAQSTKRASAISAENLTISKSGRRVFALEEKLELFKEKGN